MEKPAMKIVTALVALLVLGAAAPSAANAAYPGKPGPIAYLKYKDTFVPEGEITAVRREGGLLLHGRQQHDEVRPLTHDWQDWGPAFSPNGRLIAFNGTRESDGEGIYAVRPDGSGLRFLARGSGPYFSPDGRKLVYGSDGDLFLLTLASGASKRLTSGPHADYEAVFTPNGKQIVFSSDRKSDGRHDESDIWTVAAKGGKPRLLIDGSGSERHPETSPNGRRIVYVVEKAYGSGHGFGVGSLRFARSDGTYLRSLGEAEKGECDPCYSEPTFAPDGKHLAVIGTRKAGTSLLVMKPDGSHVRGFDAGTVEIDGYGRHVGQPAWGPRPR
jgi:TolB protein